MTFKMDNAAEEETIMSQGTLPREHPSSWKRKRKEHEE
jgi:hypothetical protein